MDALFADILRQCNLCPRSCKVNRLEGEIGYCGAPPKLKIYTYFPHKGEEPPISGENGSGIVFFSHCPLKCVYCQNYKFSHLGEGVEISIEELSTIFIKLQNLKCTNINLVTGTHFIPWIIESLNLASRKGLKLPIVWNSSGFENPQIIKLLKDYIDIYLVDLRYVSSHLSKIYSNFKDYFRYARDSITEMILQKPSLEFTPQGTLKKGVIIRILCLPGHIKEAEKILKEIQKLWGFEHIGISILTQYQPFYKAQYIESICRPLNNQEIKQINNLILKFPIINGWIQENRGECKFWGNNFKKAVKI